MQAAAAGPDAIVIPDTALPTVDRIARLEAIAGSPVVTANQVTLWAALRLAGRSVVSDAYGRLFGLAERAA
jgi:maleate cis-trans isomerase